MEVTIYLINNKDELVYKNVVAIYAEFGFLCVKLSTKRLHKYPLCNVLRIEHSEKDKEEILAVVSDAR